MIYVINIFRIKLSYKIISTSKCLLFTTLFLILINIFYSISNKFDRMVMKNTFGNGYPFYFIFSLFTYIIYWFIFINLKNIKDDEELEAKKIEKFRLCTNLHPFDRRCGYKIDYRTWWRPKPKHSNAKVHVFGSVKETTPCP